MHQAFQVHMLNEVGKARAQEIAQGFDSLLKSLEQLVPEGRAKSILITKLEEAAFFAKKAMAELTENQQK